MTTTPVLGRHYACSASWTTSSQKTLFQSLQHDGLSRTLMVLWNVAWAERVQLGGPGSPAQNSVGLQPR